MVDPVGCSLCLISTNDDCTSRKIHLFNIETQNACFSVPVELHQVCKTREALWHSWGKALTTIHPVWQQHSLECT